MRSKIFLVMILIAIPFIGIAIKISNSRDDVNEEWWADCINISDAWNKTKGNENVLVGLIDSGVNVKSKYLEDSIYINQLEIPNNGIDDDLNGYIDDINGWNFYDNSNRVYTSYSSDYHGTMIAGIIASNHIDDNLYGIAPDITMVPLKCFKGNSGDVKDVIEAIEYAYELGVRIFNCSYSTSTYSDELYNIIDKYDDAVFICSYSGTNDNVENIYPAAYDLENIISVGGFTIEQEKYNIDSTNEFVDIYAPSTQIKCLLPDDMFESSDGTSLATAFVSGCVALVVSENYPMGIEIDIAMLCDSNNYLYMVE